MPLTRCAKAQGLTDLLARAVPKKAAVEEPRTTARAGVRFKPPASFSKFFSVRYALAPGQELVFGAELDRFTSFSSKSVELAGREPEWKFKGLPVTVGYVHRLGRADWPVTPEVGVGVSAVLCKTSLRDYEPVELGLREGPLKTRGYGAGYGAQATLGLRGDVGERFFYLAQGRLRYVNGFGFTGGTDRFDNEFAKFDFAVGMGVNF